MMMMMMIIIILIMSQLGLKLNCLIEVSVRLCHRLHFQIVPVPKTSLVLFSFSSFSASPVPYYDMKFQRHIAHYQISLMELFFREQLTAKSYTSFVKNTIIDVLQSPKEASDPSKVERKTTILLQYSGYRNVFRTLPND